MVDVFAIQQLLARYTRYADQRDGTAMAQLFVPMQPSGSSTIRARRPKWWAR